MGKQTYPPVKLHVTILLLLIVPALLSLLYELSIPNYVGGMLFSRYSFTRLIFILWMLYGLFSTLVVFGIILILKMQGRELTRTSVFLSHLVPVLVGFTFLQLGWHDKIEDFFKESGRRPVSNIQRKIPKRKPVLRSPQFIRPRLQEAGGGALEAKPEHEKME